MLDTMFDLAALGPERVRPLRRREYEQLVGLGVFADERVELLRGVLVAMSPQGEPHSRITAWLAHRFARALDIARYDVRSHSGFAASVDSMPEPDISVSRRTARGGHPSEALLLVEVAETSLAKDRSIKTEIYAQAGVPEYWIVNVRKRAVEVLTRPSRSGYDRVVTRAIGDVLRPTRLRGLEIVVADIPWTSRSRKRR
jgi:Uma2 family endonuclease